MALPTISKSFIRPHLDYRDIIYDKAFNKSFHLKLVSLQYKATLAITGAMRGSSTEKIYEGLGLESFKMLVQKNEFFVQSSQKWTPSYPFNTIPKSNTQRQTRNSGNIPSFLVKHDYFKNSFFPSAIIEWNILDCYTGKENSFEAFKKRILSLIRPMPNSIYNIHNPLEIRI